MTQWALVIILCGRPCTPQYVELYSSKAVCETSIPDKSKGWATNNPAYCVPAVKGEQK